jgi:replicative DNA helicase
MVTPSYEAERQLAEEGSERRGDADTRKQIVVKAAERRRQSAAMAAAGEQKGKEVLDPDQTMAAAINASRQADAIDVPPIPQLVADDITPEAAASLLAEQGGRLAIISAEGGIFDIVAGRYNNDKANMDLWLKGHSGDPLRVDRQGRETGVDVAAAALTMGLMIQPQVLSNIVTNREFRGLLARCLYAWPVSMVGRRRKGASVPPEVAETYTSTMLALVKAMSVHARGNPVT